MWEDRCVYIDHPQVGIKAHGALMERRKGVRHSRTSSLDQGNGNIRHESPMTEVATSRSRYDVRVYPSSQRLEMKRRRKRAEFLDSIGMKMDTYPDPCDLPHIYLPRLHRQQTEKVPKSDLGESLEKMVRDNGIEEQMPGSGHHLSAVRREVQEFSDSILAHLKKSGTDMEFKRPILVDSFAPWRTRSREVSCLLPVVMSKAKVKALEPGYVVLQLPNRDSNGMDEFSKLRTDDKLHLSCKKTYQMFINILKKVFQKRSIPIERLRLVMRDNGFCILYELRNYGWRMEIIPAVHIQKSSAVLIPKPFDIDENVASVMRWRVCWVQREAEIIRSISCTDKGLRVKALHVVCKLCEKDWRLQSLTPYQLQTVLLFDMDYHVDNSPRWQRSSLEDCVTSLLNRLFQFAKTGCLPHFIIDGLDLFGLLEPKTVILYKSALVRLTTNQRALISLLERTRPDIDSDPTQWLEPKPDHPTRPHGQIPMVSGVV